MTVSRRNVPSSHILGCFGGGQNSWFPQDRNSLQVNHLSPSASHHQPPKLEGLIIVQETRDTRNSNYVSEPRS